MAVDSYGRTVYESGYDYDDVYRRRLAAIQQQDKKQSEYSRTQSQLQQSQRDFNEAMGMRYAGLESSALGHSNVQSLMDYGSDLQGRVNMNANMWEMGQQGGQLGAFINSIAGQESGGNYGAVNRHSGALGKYQIMASNISAWSKETIGRAVTPSQFLSSPQIQEQIARAKLTSYFQKYGPAGAAIAWYAGPAAAQRYVQTGRISRASQGSYPSIMNYVQQIMKRMRSYG